MKKIVVLSFFACLLLVGCVSVPKASSIKSEVPHSSKIYKNLRAVAGVGLSDIKGGKSWSPKIGGVIGVETKVCDINEKSSVNAGIGGSMQGAAYTEEYDYIDPYEYSLKSATASEHELSGKVTLNYLIFPVLYKYIANSGFYGEIGLQPAILLSAKDKIDGDDGYDYKDFVNGFDVGVPFGAGYNINEQLSIGARGIYGLLNNSDSGSGDNDHNLMILGVLQYNFGSLINK